MPAAIHADERISIQDTSYLKSYANHIQRYEFAAPHAAGRRVLDAGCGTGYGSSRLATLPDTTVTAVDISEQALAEARKLYARDNLRFLQGDVEQLAAVPGVEPPYDVVINFENLEHLKHPDRFLAEARRLLAPDGTLVLSTPNGDLTPLDEAGRVANNPYHEKEYTEAELRTLLQNAGFTVEALFGQWQTPEGRFRILNDKHTYEYLLYLYDNPANRLWTALKRLLGKRALPPPDFLSAGSSYPWEWTIRPLTPAPYPWAPAIFLAIARPGPAT